MRGICDYPGCDEPAPYHCDALECTHEMCRQHQFLKSQPTITPLDESSNVAAVTGHHFCWEHAALASV